MQNQKTKDFLVHAILFICVVGLLAGYVFLLRDFAAVKKSSSLETNTTSSNIYTSQQTNCDENCKAQIAQELEAKLTKENPTSSLTPTPTSASKTMPQTYSTPVPGKTTTYIPFTSSLSTTSTDWVDVSGDEAYVDLKNNYSASAYVTFEASMRANGGGEVFARLFDSTHGIAVSGSEISTSSTSSTLVSSGQLNLWSGNNLYKVQIKSLNSFNVTFDSGRIKLVY